VTTLPLPTRSRVTVTSDGPGAVTATSRTGVTRIQWVSCVASRYPQME
jgi:hypothetical protein